MGRPDFLMFLKMMDVSGGSSEKGATGQSGQINNSVVRRT